MHQVGMVVMVVTLLKTLATLTIIVGPIQAMVEMVETVEMAQMYFYSVLEHLLTLEIFITQVVLVVLAGKGVLVSIQLVALAFLVQLELTVKAVGQVDR
jgi:hypothetical protein